ncbi:DUF2513 domain-containing protein [Erysipelothrix rhusiopathiae]|nr:DUF2513 domain-containing protein [Erysipelothrix rhusiopathiae]
MELKHDCVRNVLLYLENELQIIEFRSTNAIPIGYDQVDIDYAILKLMDAGFIKGKYSPYVSGGYDINVSSITWEGHKFLDTIRDNEVWSKTKSISKSFSSVSLNMISSIATNIITAKITGQI